MLTEFKICGEKHCSYAFNYSEIAGGPLVENTASDVVHVTGETLNLAKKEIISKIRKSEA